MGNELQNYTDLILKIKTYKEQNADVFRSMEVLEDNLSVAEQELKSAAKKEKTDMDNGVVSVSFIQPYRRWYELSAFSPKTKKILKANGAIIEKEPEIDKVKLEELAKKEIVSREEVRNAYKEEAMAPSIRIKLL